MKPTTLLMNTMGFIFISEHPVLYICQHTLFFIRMNNYQLRLSVLNCLRIFSLKLFLIYNQSYYYASSLNKLL